MCHTNVRSLMGPKGSKTDGNKTIEILPKGGGKSFQVHGLKPGTGNNIIATRKDNGTSVSIKSHTPAKRVTAK